MAESVRPLSSISRVSARDIMNSPVAGVPSSASIREAAALMTQEDISGLAVWDEGTGQVVGVVSAKDLVRCEAGRRFKVISENEFFRDQEEVRSSDIDEGFQIETVIDEPVSTIMTPYVVRATPDDPVGYLADLMFQHQIHRVFIEEDGGVVGVVTAFDISSLMVGT